MSADPASTSDSSVAADNGRPAGLLRSQLGLGTKLIVVTAGVVGIVALLAPWLPIDSPSAQDLSSNFAAPGWDQWLGTDRLGRDVLSRTLWGARTTLLAALVAITVSTTIGVPSALLAGYRRGWIDGLLDRMSDTIMIVPGLVLLLAAQAALQSGIYVSMALFGVIAAPHLFRVLRSVTLETARASFVQAARMSGCSHWRIVYRYMLPNVREQIAVQVSFQLGFALIVEAGISFLGVGVQPPDASLGRLLFGASSIASVAPYVIIAPALVLILFILAANVIGDALAHRRVRSD